MPSVFVLAASVEYAFIGQAARLSCEVEDLKAADWIYQESENASRHLISVNGTLSGDYDGYTIDGSSLVINEVRSSDAGIYICGRGGLLYHKLRLSVSGE